MNKLTYGILFFLAILFSGCQKDAENPNSNQNNHTIEDPADPPFSSANPQLSGTQIQTSFIGKIIDLNGNKLAGAQIRIGTSAATANNDGLFHLQNVPVDEQFALIEVSKSGYFKQFRNIIPRTDEPNTVVVKMIPKVFNGSFNTDEGGEITMPDGGKIIFSAGDLQKFNGELYSGNVMVASTYLNPTDPLLETYCPGSFLAVTDEDDLSTLTSFGMTGAELFTPQGEPLDLATGSFARIEFPIQEDLTTEAPNSIPLWFFDENTGIWREQGAAERTDQKYIGEVGHFTFWNVDISSNPAQFSFQVVFNNELITSSNILLSIHSSDGANAGTQSYLPMDGFVQSYAPENQEFLLRVTVNSCGIEEMRELPIGPFTGGTNTDLGTINIDDMVNFEFVEVIGDIQGCNGESIPIMAEFQLQGYESGAIFIPESDGSFEINTLVCNDVQMTELLAYSFEEMVSELIEEPWNAGQSQIDFDTVSLCSELNLDTYMFYEDELGHFFGYEGTTFVPINQADCNYAWHNDTISGTQFLIFFEEVTGLGTYGACDVYSSLLTNPLGEENPQWISEFIEDSLIVEIVEYAEVDSESYILEANWNCTVALTIEGVSDTTNAWGSFRVQLDN